MKVKRALCYFLMIAFVLPLLLSATAPQVSANPGWLSGWDYRMKITIDHTKVDADLDNFPVLIYLDSTYTDFWGHCDSEQNIVFTSSDGETQLKREVELFDHTNDNFYAHVKVPDLSNTVDTDIYIYYDSASHGQTNDADTWDDNFSMVLHMTDITTSTIEDSTANNNDGAKMSANNPIEADGKIVKAQDFSDDYIRLSDDLLSGLDSLTFSAWFYWDTETLGQFLSSRWVSPHPIMFEWQADGKVIIDQQVSHTSVNVILTTETWIKVTFVKDGTTWKIYKNGAWVEDITSADYPPIDVTSGHPYYLGAFESPADTFSRYFDGRKDEVRFSNVIRSAGWIKTAFNNENDPSSFYTVGGEELAGTLLVLSVTADNSLVDRKQDVSWTMPVLGTIVTVDVVTGVVGENADNIADNARITIKDAGGNAVVSNQTTTNISIVDENTKRFVFPAYNPDDALADANLGVFSVFTEAWSTTKYDNDTNSSAFTVDDFDNSVVPSQENLPGHEHRIYGTAARETGGSVTLTGGRRIDSNDGTKNASVSGADFENTWAPSATGSVYFELETAELDGRTDNLDYAFPNIVPEIVSISVDNSLIDRDVDYAGSGADTDTTITVRLRDNDSRSDFADAWIAVRDALDAVIDNENVFSTATVVDENQIDVTMIYDATDNTLANNQLGAWDVGAYVADAYGGTTSEWQTSKFTVDDLTSTINFNPAVPYIGWDLTVSGTHSCVVGAVSIDASWLIDNKHGQFALGASNTYNKTYTISNATLGENISVTIRTHDGVLDGVSVSSYETNDNVKFQVEVRFEENYEIIQWIPDENRTVEMLFEWDGGTYPYTLTGNPENITVPSGGIATKIVKITDNDAYWRYVIPDLPGGTLTFVLVDDPETVEQFRFFLQDYTGLYTPPDGQLLIKSWIGTNLAEINSDFWGADWRTTAWLVTGTQYQMWVRAPSAALRLVGPIDAVVPSEEKTIIVQVVISELDPIFNHVYWAAWRESGTIVRMEYHDNLDNTIEAHVGIYDMDGDLMSQYQPDNEWFIVTWPYAENTESYEVVLTVQHGIYGDFTRNVPIGFMEGPPGVPGGISEPFGLPAGVTLAALGSVILMFIMGLSFDALRVQLGVLAMALTTLFCWYMGFLPLPGPYDGAFTATLILVAAVLFALTWRRGK